MVAWKLFLGRASQFACPQNYILYDTKLIILLYTLTITLLYAMLTIRLLYTLTMTLSITLQYNVNCIHLS